MSNKRSRNAKKRQEKESVLARLIPSKATFDAAQKLQETTPPTILGIRRSLAFGILAGLADYARDVVKSPETKAEMTKAHDALKLAFYMEVVKEGVGEPEKKQPEPKVNVGGYRAYTA